MKKGLNLFSGKKAKRRPRKDDFDRYDERYEDGYDEEDYPDEEFEEEYGDEVDDRYEDEDYPKDERYEDEDYPEDDRYKDEDYPEEDDRYEDEDYPEEDDRYEDEEYSDSDYENDEDYDSDYEPSRDAGKVAEPVATSAGRGGSIVEFKEHYPERGGDDDDIYEDEDERYEDEEYPEEGDRYEDDDDYPEDDLYEDEDYPDRDYESDDDYDYDDEYDRDVDDRYEDDYDRDYDRDDRGRGGRGGRGSRRGRERDREESVGARILAFLGNTSVAERAAAVVAVLLLAGGIAFMLFYSKAKNYAAEVGSFAEVGADLQVDGVVGSTGLLAIADAEMARAMAAGLVEEIEEEKEEVPDTASNVTIKMTLTSIKSDMKIKFINSETKKLVANVPFVVSVVTPDGTKVSYDDHDRDGIIYKKDLTAGKYKITPEALSSEYDSYKLDTSTQTLTVKDTVEMKAVDVSNEIKKESQINAAKEDTAVQTQVESVLNDTVEWVDSNQNSSTSSDGKYKYEVIDKNDIPNPSTSAMLTVGSVRRMAAARSRAKEPDPDNANNESSTEASTEGTTEAGSEGTSESASGGTTDSGSGSTTTEPETPKSMSVSLTESSIKVGQTTTINVSGPSSYNVSSDNESVATVSGNTVTAKGVGTAKITVKADGYNDASVSITVTEADKKNMTLSATSLTIKMGDTGKITVSSGPSSFTVRSSDEKIAKVASDGTITPVAEGSATITFSADGYNDASATVTVGKADKKI